MAASTYSIPGNRDTGSDITLDRNQIIQGELQILQSPALAAEVMQAVGPATVYPALAFGPLTAARGDGAFRGWTSPLTSIPQSNVVELSLRNMPTATVAIRVLNELISHYLTYRNTDLRARGRLAARTRSAGRVRQPAAARPRASWRSSASITASPTSTSR